MSAGTAVDDKPPRVRLRYQPQGADMRGEGTILAVFLSYAREDSEFAQRFCADLDRPGIEPWLDLDRLKPGRWEPALTGALGTSRYVLPLLPDIPSTPTSRATCTRSGI
jgi:hypothetical protein